MMGFGSGIRSFVDVMFLVVPLLLVAAGVWGLVSSLRDARQAARIQRVGARTLGTVVASHVSHSGGDENRSSRLVETIEFRAPTGQTVRGVAAAQDHGMLDRTGQTVTVVYDPERPELFVAPRDGQALRGGGAAFRVVFFAVFTAVALGFLGLFRLFSLVSSGGHPGG